MGAKSEFQRVLERHLGPASHSASQPAKETQTNLQDSFLDQIKFTFSPLGKIKTTIAYPKKPQSKVEPKLASLDSKKEAAHPEKVRPTLAFADEGPAEETSPPITKNEDDVARKYLN